MNDGVYLSTQNKIRLALCQDEVPGKTDKVSNTVLMSL